MEYREAEAGDGYRKASRMNDCRGIEERVVLEPRYQFPVC